MRLDALPGTFAATRLELAPAAAAPGLERQAEPGAGFAWRLDPATAADFAARADLLSRPGRDAGSDFLTCGVPDEIPVKLSRGEYTDDFLLPPGLQAARGWDTKARNDREA